MTRIHSSRVSALASEIGIEVSLSHDYLLVMRGAERTFAAIADLYPTAPIFTLLYDEDALGGRFDGHSVHTSPRALTARIISS